MFRVLVFSCVLSGLALVPASKAQPPVVKPGAERKTVEVPFEVLESGHMTIQVEIDGKGPYRMIFDTGAPTVMFSGKAAKECGLIPRDAQPFLFGTFSVQPKPASVRVGPFSATGIVANVMNHPIAEALAAEYGPIDGLVGFELFGADKVTIDYRAKTITARLPAVAKPRDPSPHKKATELMAKGPEPERTAPGAVWGISVSKEARDDKPGVDVTAVQPGSAAAEAGLKAGDRLLVLSRRWTDSVDDVHRAASFIWAGKAVKVTVQRGDKELELTVKPRAGL